MGAGMVAHLHADPTPIHLVRHGGNGPEAKETFQHQIAGIGGDVEDALDQAFGLGGGECLIPTKDCLALVLSIV